LANENKVIVTKSKLDALADSISAKTSKSLPMTITQMKDAVDRIDTSGGGITPTGTKQISITTNGTVTEDVTAYANAEISVNVVNQDYEDALVALGTQSDLTDSIEALTVYSNDITGEEDVNLSDAVHTLGSGYGQGGETDYDSAILPSEYQRVEYIESNGTQFIRLPFGFSPSDEIYTKMAIDTSMGTDKFMVCPQTWNNDNNRFGIIGVHIQKKLGVAYGSIATNLSLMATQTTNDGLLHKYSYKNKFFWSDDLDIAYGTGAAAFGADTANLKLFYGYNANTKGKIAYYVHKKENTSVVLYACYRKADGVIGLYDVDNDVFYTNDGTGTFTKGADI